MEGADERSKPCWRAVERGEMKAVIPRAVPRVAKRREGPGRRALFLILVWL
jgi:hypothetical protein